MVNRGEWPFEYEKKFSYWKKKVQEVYDRRTQLQEAYDKRTQYVEAEDKLTRVQESYAAGKLAKYISKFINNLPSPLLDDEGLKRLWEALKINVDNIRVDFSLEHIFIFGPKSIRGGLLPEMEIVAGAENLPMSLNTEAIKVILKKQPTVDPRESLNTEAITLDIKEIIVNEQPKLSNDEVIKFSLNKIPKDVHLILNTKKIINSTMYPKLFEGVIGFQLDSQKDFIQIFEAPGTSNICIVLWIRYRNRWNPLKKKRYRQSALTADRYFRTFFTLVVSALSSLMANTAKSYMESIMQVFAHETGQLTSGLEWLNSLYLSDAKKLKEMPLKKIEDFNTNIRGYIKKLYLLHKQIEVLVHPNLKPIKSRSFCLIELLLKIKDLYNLEAEAKNIFFNIIFPKTRSSATTSVYGDPALLEVLLYTLIDNAVNYCYRGTKIHMYFKKLNKDTNSPYKISIANYGYLLKEHSNLYMLFERGYNAGQKDALGIGLYVAKKIVEAHDGSIKYNVQPVSDFNVSLIEQYLFEEFPEKNRELLGPLHNALLKLKKSGKYDDIVELTNINKKHYVATRVELAKSIILPTWRVEFTVTIPSKEL